MFGFGKSVGIAFQLVDDILDFTGTEKSLGKRPLQDLREGKVTLPLLRALGVAGAADRERARRALGKKEPGDRDVAFLVGLVARHDGIGYTAARAREYVRRGKRYLAVLPDSPARSGLIALSDYVISRTN
jgi:octaprenyl-diphosphate synthase